MKTCFHSVNETATKEDSLMAYKIKRCIKKNNNNTFTFLAFIKSRSTTQNHDKIILTVDPVRGRHLFIIIIRFQFPTYFNLLHSSEIMDDLKHCNLNMIFKLTERKTRDLESMKWIKIYITLHAIDAENQFSSFILYLIVLSSLSSISA